MLEAGTFLSYADVCKLLSISTATVRRLVQRGLLAPPVRLPGKLIRFRAEDLWRYLAQAEPMPPGPAMPQDKK